MKNRPRIKKLLKTLHQLGQQPNKGIRWRDVKRVRPYLHKGIEIKETNQSEK
jgi:hypothetical protein